MSSTDNKPTRFEKPEELDWVRVRGNMNQEFRRETAKEKLIRKIGENPMVPIGCTVTVAALSFGLWSFWNGRSQMSQYMMRLRVAAQGFTIIAMVAGFVLTAQSNKK